MEKIARWIQDFGERAESRREKKKRKELIHIPPQSQPLDSLRLSTNVIRRFNEKTTTVSGIDDRERALTSRRLKSDGHVEKPPEMLFLILKIQIRRSKRAKRFLLEYKKAWESEHQLSEELYKKYGTKFEEGLGLRQRGLDDVITRRLQTRERTKTSVEQCFRIVRHLDASIADLKHCICEKYIKWNTMMRRKYLEEKIVSVTETSFCEYCFCDTSNSMVMHPALQHIQALRQAQKHSTLIDSRDHFVTIQEIKRELTGTVTAEKGCTTCFSVVYCCAEHRRADESHHTSFSCQSLSQLKLFDISTLFQNFDIHEEKNVKVDDWFSGSVGRVAQILESHEVANNQRQANMRALKKWTTGIKVHLENQRPMSARTRPQNVPAGDYMKLQVQLDNVRNFLHKMSDQQKEIQRYGERNRMTMILGGPDSETDEKMEDGNLDPVTQFKAMQTLIEMRETLKLRSAEAEKYKLERDDAFETLKESRELFSREFARQRKQMETERKELAEEKEKLALLRKRILSKETIKYPTPDVPSESVTPEGKAVTVPTETAEKDTQTDNSEFLKKMRTHRQLFSDLKAQQMELSIAVTQQLELAALEISKSTEFISSSLKPETE